VEKAFEENAKEKAEVEEKRAQLSSDIQMLRRQAQDSAKERIRNRALNASVNTLRSLLNAARNEATQSKQEHTKTREILAGLEADVQSIITSRNEAVDQQINHHHMVLNIERELQRVRELATHEVKIKEEDLAGLCRLLVTRDSEIERLSSVERELEHFREGYHLTLREASALKEELKRLRDHLAAVQDSNQAALHRERDLKNCRSNLLRLTTIALRIMTDAESIDDIQHNRPLQILDRTLSHLNMCRFILGRMESLAAETPDAHKTTSEYLRKAMPTLRKDIRGSSRIIELLRGEKMTLVRGANRLEQAVIRMDEQIKRLKSQVT
jgi:hypothetical protein